MLILLPPSEGKSAPSRGKPLDLEALSFPGLGPTRERVLNHLIDLCADPASAAEVLELGPTQQHLAAANTELRSAPTTRADRVYSGVLFEALDLHGLDGGAKRRAGRRVAVTSALFGLVRPADRIPAYRLSGGVSLPGLGTIAGAWREPMGEAITDALGSGLLVDLRSGTYQNFWRPDVTIGARTVALRVLVESGGVRKVVSHANKATKGRIARDLLVSGADPRTPTAFTEALTDLGWHVEAGKPGARGTTLDVIVDAV